MTSTLYAMQNGAFDDVEVERIEDCQEKFEEFLDKPEGVPHGQDPRRQGDHRRDRQDDLTEAIDDFKKSYS